MGLNILQINTADTKGGAGKVAYRLQNELKKRGYKTSYLVARKYSKNNDVKLIRSDSNLRRRILGKLSYYLANDLDLFPSKHILKLPEFKSADIIHCHNLHSNYFNFSILEKISRLKPIIWTFHDMWPITAHCAHSFDGPVKKSGFFTCPSLDIYPAIAWHNEKYLENRKTKVYTNSNFHIITPSKWLADKVGQSVLKDKPLTIIYNGVDTSVFKPWPKSQCRHELNLPQNKKIILIIAKRGQSNPWKGGNYVQDIINDYCNNIDTYFIDLGGDENKTGANTKTVSYVNDQETLAKYYSAADMLLYPSIADNCPLVVLEAMACGLPVVTFNTGGIPELIEHKINGYIAEYKNVYDLKSGVAYLLNMPHQEIEEMKQNSVNKISAGCTIEKMADQYVEIYQKIFYKN